jgi:hypothetical protein
MKTILKISVLLNVISLSGALLLYWHPRTGTVPAPANPAMEAELEPQIPPAPVVQMVAATFRWSQLESTNGYLAFVANLRAADCPEATVEDIVWGNVERAFSWEREKMQVDASEPGPWSSQAQAQMLAYFLGQGPAPMAEELANSQSPNQPAGTTMPLILQNIDLSTLKLSDAETQAIASIRETFLNNLGGANQDTNDPAYIARWQKAQSQADNMLQVMVGGQSFMQYQVMAYQMSLQNQETSAGN